MFRSKKKMQESASGGAGKASQKDGDLIGGDRKDFSKKTSPNRPRRKMLRSPSTKNKKKSIARGESSPQLQVSSGLNATTSATDGGGGRPPTPPSTRLSSTQSLRLSGKSTMSGNSNGGGDHNNTAHVNNSLFPSEVSNLLQTSTSIRPRLGKRGSGKAAGDPDGLGRNSNPSNAFQPSLSSFGSGFPHHSSGGVAGGIDHNRSSRLSNSHNNATASTALLTTSRKSLGKSIRGFAGGIHHHNNHNNAGDGIDGDHAPKPKLRKYQVRDPADPTSVGHLVTHLVPTRSPVVISTNTNLNTLVNESLLVLRVARFEFSGTDVSIMNNTTHNNNVATSTGPGTMAMGSDYITHAYPNKNKSIRTKMNPKSKNKLRYVCITRSTNRALLKQKKNMGTGVLINGVEEMMGGGSGDADHGNNNGEEEDSEDEDGGSDVDDNDDYSLLYNPEVGPNGGMGQEEEGGGEGQNGDQEKKSKRRRGRGRRNASHRKMSMSVSFDKIGVGGGSKSGADGLDKNQQDISSFPSLVCIAIQTDGTNPHVRQVLDLDKLVAIESVPNKGMVQLVFQNGIVVEIDCEVEEGMEQEESNPMNIMGMNMGMNNVATSKGEMQKNRLLWSLLQIHAILCTSVVERNRLSQANGGAGPAAVARGTSVAVGRRTNITSSSLPQLTMRNVDRAELQYISTVNGFLSDNPVLCVLLEQQRNLSKYDAARRKESGGGDFRGGGGAGDSNHSIGEGEEKNDDGIIDDMDGIAYDMIMGNFTRLTLFVSEEEKQDAEEVLNSTLLERSGSVLADGTSPGDGKPHMEEIDTVELTALLQKRMRDLEAETCRRLIAWEDEKYYSASGTAPIRRDTMEAHGLSNLFATLDDLDTQLERMEEWLSDKASAIKPLTDECRDVEEVNRQMEQQQYSYELLASELARLLDGLEVEDDVVDILKNPESCIQRRKDGSIDLQESEGGVEKIYGAGKTLKLAFDKVQEEGGVHLRAISERVEGLLDLSNQFCKSVAQIVVSVMKRTVGEVSDKDDSSKKEDKNQAHASISKSLRSTQRQFQSSLLAYIKLIEVLALLKPSILPSVREGYSTLVAEGVLNKKRMKTYFMSLPGKSSVNMEKYTIDLSTYSPVTLRSMPNVDPNQHMKPVQAKDVEIALSELLPVIAREAYFTAALFGLSAKHLSGREKKRNFESAKRSVDFSSQYFKYYIARICGIASEADAEGKTVRADPMLSLVASILLNEAMDSYIDRQKKGGDHSLSLAYVRATILDLRKKVDKQWVSWVEEQIKWIQTNPGVPLTGKRAGVFTSFARFPSYLDHVMICCKAGRPKDHVPNLSKIKVVTYYLQKLAAALFNSLHQCSERETTDQQYAANVMRMENSYFFTQTIKQRGSELTELLQKQITAASSICKQSTDAYLGFMIKREFKSLHTLFASISRIRREVGDADVPIHVPRSTFEKTLSKECNREILKEKIGSIYFRMEKHLSEAGGLLPVAWKALVKVLYEWFGRWQKVSSQCYKFTLEPSASDVVRIAKQAAGISAKKISDEKKKNASGGGSQTRNSGSRSALQS